MESLIIEVEPQKRIETETIEYPCISLYHLKKYRYRKILELLEVFELKNLCGHLKIKRSGTKAELINRIIKSEKIQSIGLLTC